METLLFVNGCVRGAQSRTLALAHCFLDELKRKHPELTIETADLNALRLQPLYEDTLAARNAASRDWSAAAFAPARAFRDAGRIVLAAPFWEGTFPAALHTYLEHICVSGLTFACTAQGYTGLCRARDAVFLTTRGGIYERGPAAADDHAAPFLTSMLRMLGIPRLYTIAAEGLDIEGFDAQGALDAARARAISLARAL